MGRADRLRSTGDPEREPYPHHWQELEAIANFDGRFTRGEWDSERMDGAAAFVEVNYLSPNDHISIGTEYYIGESTIPKHAETEMHVGVDVELTPERARELARSLMRAADLAERRG